MTTTSYGTWCNRVQPFSLTVEQSALEAFGSECPDGFDFAAIVSEYRAAINGALPPSVTLAGDEFTGPYEPGEWDGYPVDQDGNLDIKAIVDGIDFWAIATRHQH